MGTRWLTLVLIAVLFVDVDRWAVRVAHSFDTSAAPLGRMTIWEEAVPIARDFRLTGTGAGTFHLVYHRAPPAHDAHSLYLQAFAELGIVGLLLVVAIIALPLVESIRHELAAPAAVSVRPWPITVHGPSSSEPARALPT